MTARRLRHIGQPAMITIGAVLVAVLAIQFLAGAALAASPGKPTAKAPKGAIATTTPTFTWGKAARATKYEVRVYNGSKQVLRKTGIAKLSWKSSKALPQNVSLTWKVRAGNATGSGPWSKKLKINVALAIGDTYQGGKVAYLLQSGDPGYDVAVTHGLIAAPADQSAGIRWYNGTFVVTGATGTALGTGSANTDAIIAVQGAAATDYAAGLARAYNGGGYTDWYLPSKDELNELYLNQVAIGGFSSQYYWSSFEFGADFAWYERFSDGNQFYWDKSSTFFRVRAVRSF